MALEDEYLTFPVKLWQPVFFFAATSGNVKAEAYMRNMSTAELDHTIMIVSQIYEYKVDIGNLCKSKGGVRSNVMRTLVLRERQVSQARDARGRRRCEDNRDLTSEGSIV
ncbi:hypothetical protein N7490_011983 [Penicillium lividum]|nr:hypothetical protein N7490_011983 [Penicillium lividum]